LTVQHYKAEYNSFLRSDASKVQGNLIFNKKNN